MKLCDSLEGGNVLVLPDAQVGNRDAAFRKNRGGLQHDQARAALRAAAQVDQVPVVGKAILRGVLAHGRDADAVGKRDRTKLEGRKKRMGHNQLDGQP